MLLRTKRWWWNFLYWQVSLIKDEQVYTTSRIVAEKFGKRHAHIIRDIEAQAIENKAQLNFELNENIDGLKNQPVKNDYFIADINVLQVMKLKINPNLGLVKTLKSNMYEKGGIYFLLLFFIPY